MSGIIAANFGRETFVHKLTCLKCTSESLETSLGVYYLLSNGGYIKNVFKYNVGALVNLAKHLGLDGRDVMLALKTESGVIPPFPASVEFLV